MSWHQDAACRGRSDIDWFPAHDPRPALAVCADCPVKASCLSDALEETYQNGVRGGMTPVQREHLAGKRRVARCGTDAGYSRHRRLDEDPCHRCRDAHNEANRERVWRRRA